MTTTINHQLQQALTAGIDYLVRAQDTNGSWSDFWLPVGTSDAWVTAYVGLALHSTSINRQLSVRTRQRAVGVARRAGVWLVGQQRPQQGWGYNRVAPPDADSTAHALSLLARLHLPIPAGAVTFLSNHLVSAIGYQTYRCAEPSDQWTQPACDITASVLRALYDVGTLDQDELSSRWQALLGTQQDEQGWWCGYWWSTPNYTTALALDLWRLAGCPPLTRPVEPALPQATAFDCAWAVQIQRLVGKPADPLAALQQLLIRQQHDGGWPTDLILQVPPAHAGSGRQTMFTSDARRLFTTATAVRALNDALADLAGQDLSMIEVRSPMHAVASTSTAQRSAIGHTFDELIQQAAHAVGFAPAAAQQAAVLFAHLTATSLREPSPWPAAQLSSLSGGVPLEFSATVGEQVKPALRYAVEVGSPFLPPHDRACSALQAIARTASYLGYDAAWSRISPALAPLVAPNLTTADAQRFWVWGGVDQAVQNSEQPFAIPGLKIYLNLLHRSGRTRQRLEQALAAAAFPPSATRQRVLDRLDEIGFPHEMGFGLGPKGKCASKIYYELRGWRRGLISDLLADSGLPSAVDTLCPQIPGILLEPLAAKSRAGIALRIDPSTGQISELSTAMAFPTPFLPLAQTAQRVEAWIESQGWNGATYQALLNLLLPAWNEAQPRFGHLHTLFTRTVTVQASWSSIYLRPCLTENNQKRFS